MFCNDMEKLSNFACNLGILHKKILLMPYENDVKMYKIMTYHLLKRAKVSQLELFKRPLATFLTNGSIVIMSYKYSGAALSP